MDFITLFSMSAMKYTKQQQYLIQNYSIGLYYTANLLPLLCIPSLDELVYLFRNISLSVEFHILHEEGNILRKTELLSLVWSVRVQQQTSSLNSKSKHERTNTSFLSVNTETNTKADKHKVEQTGYDNKQVGQIMSNRKQKK